VSGAVDAVFAPDAHRGPVVLGSFTAGPVARRVAERLGRAALIAPRDRRIADLPGAVAGQRSALVCLLEREMTLETVTGIIERSLVLRLPFGLLPVPEDDATADRLVASLGRAPRRYPHRSALYCDFVDEWTGPADNRYGRAGSTRFMALLADGVEVAVVHAHGNGGDFRVGEHVLCVKVGRRPGGTATARHLPCWGSGPCRLDHRPGFLAFHGPRAVRARIAAFLSCATVQTADGMLDPADLFVTHLRRAPETEAVLASLRINLATPEVGTAVLRALDAGRPVGRVALQLNSLSRYGPPSFVCLGDPEVRACAPPPAAPTDRPAAAGVAAVDPAAVRPAAAPRRRWTEPAALLFAADLLADLNPARRAVRRALQRASAGSPTEEDALDQRLLSELSRHADRLPNLAAVWGRRCVRDLGGATTAALCHRCGTMAAEETWRSMLYRDCTRTVRRCPVHGVLTDRPAGPWPAAAWLSVDPQGVGTIGGGMGPNARIAVVPIGGPARRLVLGRPHHGPLTVVAVAGGRFALAAGLTGLAAP
jgi:hypothetical protein